MFREKRKNKKKVLFFIRALNAGGAERQLVVTAKGLSERGHDVAVLTFYGGGFYENELAATSVRMLSLHKKGRWDMLAFFFRLVFLLRSERPDVVYSFLGGANIFSALFLPFVPHTRSVWGVRASNMDLERYDWSAKWSYWVECRLARFADAIVANSYAGFEYAVAHGFPRSNTLVIHNGIDTERFRPDDEAGARVRHAWGIADHERLVGLVGRVDPMKGHATFLQAAALISQQLSNVRFVFIGNHDGEHGESIRKLASELNIDEALIWAGVSSDMRGIYNALDMVSSSSFGEGFSNVVGEAMACGVPCVVTDVGDSALVVGEFGLVVLPGDSEALCAAWINVFSFDAEQLQEISVSARCRIVEHFSVDALLSTTEDLLCADLHSSNVD